MDDNELMTLEQLCAFLGPDVTPQTIHNLRYRDRASAPPAIKVGRTLKFRRADITRWLDQRAERDAARTR